MRHVLHACAIVVATVTAATPVGAAREQHTEIAHFSSSTVRPTPAGTRSSGSAHLFQQGWIEAGGMTLRHLIRTAYRRHLLDRRVVEGGDAWVDSERFSVSARAATDHILEPDGFPRATLLMLRALLATEFRLLMVERETRYAFARRAENLEALRVLEGILLAAAATYPDPREALLMARAAVERIGDEAIRRRTAYTTVHSLLSRGFYGTRDFGAYLQRILDDTRLGRQALEAHVERRRWPSQVGGG
jgi:hypothetical protein